MPSIWRASRLAEIKHLHITWVYINVQLIGAFVKFIPIKLAID